MSLGSRRLWRDSSLGVKAVAALVLALLPLTGSLVVLGAQARSIAEVDERLRVEREAQLNYSLVMRSMIDAETGVRGYLLTSDGSFLEPYQEAQRRLPGLLERSGSGSRSSSEAEIRQLRRTAESQLAALEALVTGGPAVAELLETKARMDELRRQMESIEEASERATEHLLERREALQNQQIVTLVAGGLLSLAAAAAAGFLLVKGIVRRVHLLTVNADRLNTEKELEPIPGGADELGLLAQRLREAALLLRARQSELRQSKEEADRANRAKSEFLSRMSHELRTPLNAVLGFAQLLEMEGVSEEQREGTQQIIKGGRRLLDLINEVLDISRIETGTLRLSLEPVLVREVVQDSIELIRPLAREQGIRLRDDLSPEVSAMHVMADQQRLGQVLLNLLSNGVKYNAEGGAVSVTGMAVQDGRVRVGVTDTGPGIAEDRISLLFTPFERLGAEGTDVEGTGLGLALSKSLVEAMGGSVEVDTMMGEGTTFWITLERAHPPVHESPTAPSRERPHVVGAGATVLYVEDNLSNLRLVERLLSNKDLELIPAMTGRLGEELAQQHGPDLILLDLHLPDVRGDEVLIRLRKDPRTRDIPVVMLSADATPGQIERLHEAGANEYLTKPLDVQEFLRIVDRILAS